MKEPGQADLAEIAPAFIEVAHRIVWCTVATVDLNDRPRTGVLYPIREWDGRRLRVMPGSFMSKGQGQVLTYRKGSR